MTRRTNLSRRCLAAAAVVAAVVAGCEKKKPPPAPAPAPPTRPAVVIPDKVEVQALLQQLGSDARVQFPQSAAPTDRSLAEGVIRLADALARGDAPAMRGLLDRAGQAILDELVGTGGWEDGTKKIEAVRVVRVNQSGYERPTASVATAIQEPGGAYVLVWQAAPAGSNYVFSPRLASSGVKTRASEWDNAPVEGSIGFDPEELKDMLSGGGLGRDDRAPDEEKPTTQPPNTIRKNTPGGPVNIPTGPGGG